MPTVLFYDEFTGASNSDLGGRTPDTNGTSWGTRSRPWGASGNIGVNGSGKSNTTGTTIGTSAWYQANTTGTVPQSPLEIEWKMTSTPGSVSLTNFGVLGCYFRCSSAASGGTRIGWWVHGSTKRYLIARDSGTGYTSYVTATTASANDVVIASITGADAWTLKVNGSTIYTWPTGFTGSMPTASNNVWLFSGEVNPRSNTASMWPNGVLEYIKITDMSPNAYSKNLILGGGLI